LIEEGRSFPFVVASPQCPLNQPEWDWQILDGVLTDIEKNYRIDPTRVYLTGLSMGGYGSWTWAMHQPKRFAALAPICGRGDPTQVCVLKDMPVWTFHGAKDDVIPIQKTEDLVISLRECGGNVKFTIYPEAKHDSWSETYNNPELYRWLLRQKN
jgi:predicted peptidase